MSKVIIMGLGEIGKALNELCVEAKHNIKIVEKDWNDTLDWISCDFLLVNIPYSKEFITEIARIVHSVKPGMIVINSTIPLGTTRKVAVHTRVPTIHSPVRGVHPRLKEGLLTFVKYVGSSNKKSSLLACDFFKTLGIKTRVFNNPEETELAKLLCTTTYGVYIAWATEVKRICDEEGLCFENVYTDLTRTYNQGYIKLGMDDVVRPVLKPCENGFGGHCVFENSQLLKGVMHEEWKIHIDKIGKAKK